jgi:3-oxoacyl-[acyl-carrier protein] reductase
MNVILMTHQPEHAQELINAIEAAGYPGKCEAFAHEQGKGPAEHDESTYEEILKKYGSVDVVINNTGANGKVDSIDTVSGDDLMRSIDQLVGNSYKMMKAALPYLRKSAAPRVIFMTTVEGCQGGTMESFANAVAKGAVRSLTLNAAARLASEGITVNCIAKGAIPRVEPLRPGSADPAVMLPSIPMGRLGSPKDIAAAICFLASEESNYITGQILDVSGGLNLGR